MNYAVIQPYAFCEPSERTQRGGIGDPIGQASAVGACGCKSVFMFPDPERATHLLIAKVGASRVYRAWWIEGGNLRGQRPADASVACAQPHDGAELHRY